MGGDCILRLGGVLEEWVDCSVISVLLSKLGLCALWLTETFTHTHTEYCQERTAVLDTWVGKNILLHINRK